MKSEPTEERKAFLKTLSGQLWEPCRCGREPVYMSKGSRCEKCAWESWLANTPQEETAQY